jgi:hypothetical protein
VQGVILDQSLRNFLQPAFIHIIHDFDKKTKELVDHFARSLSFTVLESSPNGHCFSVLIRILIDKLLVIDSTPRRHGREKGVNVHFGHSSLREAHDSLKVFRLDIQVHFTVDVGDE